MKWLDRLSLLLTFCGSFLSFWIVYYLINLAAGFLALGPEGQPVPIFHQVMEFLARLGSAVTGSLNRDTAVFRATTFFAFIFAVVRTVLARKKMRAANDQPRSHEEF